MHREPRYRLPRQQHSIEAVTDYSAFLMGCSVICHIGAYQSMS